MKDKNRKEISEEEILKSAKNGLSKSSQILRGNEEVILKEEMNNLPKSCQRLQEDIFAENRHDIEC